MERGVGSHTVLSVNGVSKRFILKKKKVEREIPALAGVSFDVREGEFLSIVGPSGCGKSTVLNLVVGLLKPTSGDIRLRGEKIEGVNPEIGYVTQKDNLWPWRTLKSNVAFALEVRGTPKEEREGRAEAFIQKVGLGGFEEHYPHELSGGMRQRGNIIRTLIYDPVVILMDEPFGPLDAQTRMVLQSDLLKLWDESKKTIIFVTHDLVEAIALANRVIIMTRRPGKVKDIIDVTIPRPRNVYAIHTSPGFKETYERVLKSFSAVSPEVGQEGEKEGEVLHGDV
jgi:NitT/TauT family transport system ATP-binding protein